MREPLVGHCPAKRLPARFLSRRNCAGGLQSLLINGRPIAGPVLSASIALGLLSACGQPATVPGQLSLDESVVSPQPPGEGQTQTPSRVPSSSPPATSADSASEEPAPVVSDVPDIPIGVTGELVPSISSIFWFTAEQEHTLNRAHYALVKECMEDQGFVFTEPAPVRQDSAISSLLFDGFIGILDLSYLEYSTKSRASLLTPTPTIATRSMSGSIA